MEASLPVNWSCEILEDCMEAIIDYRGKTPEKTACGVPLITAKVVKGGRIEDPNEFIAESEYDTWMRRGLPKSGDVLITTEAPLGEVAQLDGRRVALAQRLIALRGKPKRLDNTFLKFLLQSECVQSQLASRASGTTVLGIKQSELRQIKLKLPPLPEQQAIACILGALDDKIELNRRRNATLEGIARALFQSWFVDFDPVKAKAAGRPPAGLSPNLAALFPASLEDSELGPIPAGWQFKQSREIATICSGGTPLKSNLSYWGGNIPWISPKVMNEVQVFDSEERVTEEAIGNGTRLVAKGAVLVMVRGMGLHQGVRISQARRDVTFNQDVKAFVPTCVPESFLFLGLLTSAAFLFTKVQPSGHGTGVLPTEFLETLNFAIPPEDALETLASHLTAITSQIANAREQSLRLAEIRDTLLPKLISGELRIADVGRIVERCL